MMQLHQNKDKNIIHIPLDLSELLEEHRVELPTHIILEMCEGEICKHIDKPMQDGEIFLMNFIDGGVRINGSIKGYKDDETQRKKIEFSLDPKENCSFYGWKYSEDDKIDLTISAKLLTGQEINLLDKKTIPLMTRSNRLLFYS